MPSCLAKVFLASLGRGQEWDWEERGSRNLLCRGPGAWRWLGYGIVGLGDGRKGRDGGPDAVLRRWAAFTPE